MKKNYIDLINEIQTHLMLLQGKINELVGTHDIRIHDVYITRQEAADMLGKGLRQLDRDCKKYNIRKKRCNNGIRVSKYDIMKHLGIIDDGEPLGVQSSVDIPIINKSLDDKDLSDFERIILKHQNELSR